MPEPDPPGRRARKRERTLDLLAQTAVRLFAEHGYDAVTMEQIAASADVAKGTLYNHFPTKESALAHWIHARLAADLTHLGPLIERQPGFIGAMSLLLDASAAWCEAHRAYLPPYLRFRFLGLDASGTQAAQTAETAETASDINDAFGLLIARGQQAGELRDDFSAAHLATLFHHLYLAALMRWLSMPGLVLRTEFTAVVTLFTQGAARPHAAATTSTAPTPTTRARRRRTP